MKFIRSILLLSLLVPALSAAPIYQQNWDSTTPPAVPSGWSVDSGFTTATTMAHSGANSLKLSTSGVVSNALYGTLDTNSGNITASSWVRANGSSSQTLTQIFVRTSTSLSTGLGTGSGYALALGVGNPLTSGNSLSLLRRNAGSSTALITNTVQTSFSVDVWYKLTLHITTQGSTVVLIAQVFRESDSTYLASDGTTWSSNPSTVALTNVDSNASRITGSGYFGYRNYTPTNTVYVVDDDLDVQPLNGAYFPGTTSSGTVGTSTATISQGLAVGGTGPYSYQYQRAPDSAGSPGTWADVGSAVTGVAAGTAPSNLSDTGLSASTTYWYRVNVTDNAAATATSNPVSISTTSNALTAGSMTVVSAGSTSITASATAVTGGTANFSYQYQRAPDSAGSPGTFANVGTARTGVGAGTAPSSLTDTGLTASTTYWYRVVVTDSAAGSVTYTSASATTSATLVSGTVGVSAVSNSALNATGTAATGGVAPFSYQYQRAPDSAGSPGTFANVGTARTGVGAGTAPSVLNDTGLSASTTYWYRYIVTDNVSATATSASTSGATTSSPLVLGALNGSTATATSITLSYGGTTGGTSPYTTVLHRSTTAGFTPISGTIIATNPSFPYTDSSGLTSGVTYFYKLVVTDNVAATATTVQGVGDLWLAPLKLGFVGDSITLQNPGNGSPPTLMIPLLSKKRDQRTVAVTNRGIGSTETADWVSGSANLIAAKTAIAAAGCTHVLVMLGTNDAIHGPRSTSVFSTNLHSIVTDLVSSGYIVILNYSPYCVPGSVGSSITTEATCAALKSYQPFIDAEVNGTTVLQGDKLAFDYFAEHQSESTDGIHPNTTGAATFAQLWADAFDRAINPTSGGGTRTSTY